ncbi:hypothetical protein [Microbulbifer sp. 2205BS26-8]|uniref:hypothetical protein n=1 Tax=Microbulbifer sp. 2205BS26-8 TaxID=3064386 RepID=UPI00273E4E26|nr:hypothetical protein [Microbulbifer sp. 2205BS26-8]MDP5210574.1 hypothetical protein [Microbulbifer sp. 2205BS26-8]
MDKSIPWLELLRYSQLFEALLLAEQLVFSPEPYHTREDNQTLCIPDKISQYFAFKNAPPLEEGFYRWASIQYEQEKILRQRKASSIYDELLADLELQHIANEWFQSSENYKCAEQKLLEMHTASFPFHPSHPLEWYQKDLRSQNAIGFPSFSRFVGPPKKQYVDFSTGESLSNPNRAPLTKQLVFRGVTSLVLSHYDRVIELGLNSIVGPTKGQLKKLEKAANQLVTALKDITYAGLKVQKTEISKWESVANGDYKRILNLEELNRYAPSRQHSKGARESTIIRMADLLYNHFGKMEIVDFDKSMLTVRSFQRQPIKPLPGGKIWSSCGIRSVSFHKIILEIVHLVDEETDYDKVRAIVAKRTDAHGGYSGGLGLGHLADSVLP